MIIQRELLHKSFLTHIYQINFFKLLKYWFILVISSSWVHICNGKIFERQLQACDVINKQNWMLFYNLIWDIWIFQNYVVHLSRLKKNVFAMIRQLGPPIFFVTFISVESKWFPILKCFYDLNSKKIRI